MGYLGTKPANAAVTSEQIADGAVSTADIANSAVTAAKLADGAVTAPKLGVQTLIKVAGGTLSGASGITVDSVFTSTYVNYVIYVNAAYTGSADQDAYFQFRAGGSTNSSAAYPYSVNYINAGVNAGTAASNSGSATSWVLYDNMDSGSIFNGIIQVFNPQTPTKTTGQWFLYAEDGSNFKQMLGFGFQSQSTSFDGFTLTLQSGTLTGTYDVYGVAR